MRLNLSTLGLKFVRPKQTRHKGESAARSSTRRWASCAQADGPTPPHDDRPSHGRPRGQLTLKMCISFE
jgi:hypothetical protein